MKLTSRATLIVIVATAAVLAPAVAFAAFSAVTSNPGNEVAAGVLAAPGDLTATAHAVDNAANSGAVTLTWSDARAGSGTVDPAGYVVERRVAGSAVWQPVATPARGGVCDAGGTCAFTDATAAFNATYSYRVRSTVGNWTAGPSDVRLAASLAPDSAEERGIAATGLNSVARSGAAGLVAVGRGGRILVCPGTCTGTATWLPATSPTVNDLNRVVFDTSTTTRAWAVGDNGTVLTCTTGCTAPSGSWTTVGSGTSANLYGVFATSGYLAVVGTNRTMRYSQDAGVTWQVAETSGVGTATTFYGIAGRNARNVTVVGGTGSAGVIAGCAITGGGGGVCGGTTTALAPVTYAGGTSAPMADMRDVGHVSGGGNDNVYAVGLGGNLYVSTSTASGFAKKATGTTADLYAVAAVSQSAAAAVGGPPGSGSSVFLRCTASCSAAAGNWAVGADTLTTNRLGGIAGSGSEYWAVGAAATIRYWFNASWNVQTPPSGVTTVDPAVLATQDGTRHALATGTLTGTCAAPALVATATVPARSSASVTSATVRVTVGYGFAGPTNAGQVLLSTTNGAIWTVAALPSNVASSTARTVDLTGAVAASDADQQILLCVEGSGGGGTMYVDMVHVDVEE